MVQRLNPRAGLATALLVIVATLALPEAAHADTHGNTDSYEAASPPGPPGNSSPTSVGSGWWNGSVTSPVQVNQRYGCTTTLSPPESGPPAWCPPPYNQGWHQGIDINLGQGTTIYSQVEGTVADAATSCLDSGCGLGRLAIKSSFGRIVYLLHGSPNPGFTTAGTAVHAGDAVYTTGNNGGSTGPHLHFEVHKSVVGLPSLWVSTGPGDDINPEPFLYSCRHVFDEFNQGSGNALRHVYYNNGWQPETLDSPTSTGQYISSMCAGGGIQVFNQANGGGLRHLWSNADGTFSPNNSETMNSSPAGTSTGQYTAAVVDSLGTPHVFNQGVGGYLLHAYWTGSVWQWESVDAGNSTGAYTVTLNDSDGNLNVFNQGTGTTLRHVWRYPGPNGLWQQGDTPDPTWSVGTDIAAAVASSGGMNVFNRRWQGGLEHLWWGTNNWSAWGAERLDSSGSTGQYNCAALAAGGGYQVFTQAVGGGLRHLWYDATQGWVPETLDGGGGNASYGAYNSCGLSTNNGFQEFNQSWVNSLRHLYWGPGWTPETVDSPPSTGAYTSALGKSP